MTSSNDIAADAERLHAIWRNFRSDFVGPTIDLPDRLPGDMPVMTNDPRADLTPIRVARFRREVVVHRPTGQAAPAIFGRLLPDGAEVQVDGPPIGGLSSAELFTRCGQALCGNGPKWKEQFGGALGMKTNSVDNMSKGTSRIPEGVWLDIASLLHDRERDLPTLKAAAIELSNEPLARRYRVGRLEFRIRPTADGRFPVVEFSKGFPMGWWSALPDDVRLLPEETAAFRVAFDGVAGNPTVVGVDPLVHYPPNMQLAP